MTIHWKGLEENLLVLFSYFSHSSIYIFCIQICYNRICFMTKMELGVVNRTHFVSGPLSPNPALYQGKQKIPPMCNLLWTPILKKKPKTELLGLGNLTGFSVRPGLNSKFCVWSTSHSMVSEWSTSVTSFRKQKVAIGQPLSRPYRSNELDGGTVTFEGAAHTSGINFHSIGGPCLAENQFKRHLKTLLFGRYFGRAALWAWCNLGKVPYKCNIWLIDWYGAQ
jgi:hypothetical protein